MKANQTAQAKLRTGEDKVQVIKRLVCSLRVCLVYFRFGARNKLQQTNPAIEQQTSQDKGIENLGN